MEEIFKIKDEEGNLITIYDDSNHSIKIIIKDCDGNECDTWLCLNKEMVNKLINFLVSLEKDL